MNQWQGFMIIQASNGRTDLWKGGAPKEPCWGQHNLTYHLCILLSMWASIKSVLNVACFCRFFHATSSISNTIWLSDLNSFIMLAMCSYIVYKIDIKQGVYNKSILKRDISYPCTVYFCIVHRQLFNNLAQSNMNRFYWILKADYFHYYSGWATT